MLLQILTVFWGDDMLASPFPLAGNDSTRGVQRNTSHHLHQASQSDIPRNIEVRRWEIHSPDLDKYLWPIDNATHPTICIKQANQTFLEILISDDEKYTHQILTNTYDQLTMQHISPSASSSSKPIRHFKQLGDRNIEVRHWEIHSPGLDKYIDDHATHYTISF